MHTVSCQGIKEYRECCHEGLSFTGSHLRNLSLMQYDTSEELYVIVHHVPFEVVSTRHPVVAVDSLVVFDSYEILCSCKFTVEIICSNNHFVVLGKSSGCILHDAEGNRQYLVEHYFIFVQDFLFQLVYLIEDFLSLIDRRVFDFRLQTLDLFLFIGYCVLQLFLQFFCAFSQLVVCESFDFGVSSFYLLYDRLNLLHIAC